jgi:hypothetical protein
MSGGWVRMVVVVAVWAMLTHATLPHLMTKMSLTDCPFFVLAFPECELGEWWSGEERRVTDVSPWFQVHHGVDIELHM